MTGKKYGVSALFIWQASGYNRISCWFSCTMSSLAGLKVHSHLAYIVHFAILHLPLNVFKIGLVNRIEPSRPSCSSMSYSELFVRTQLEASDQTNHKTTLSAGCQLSPILYLKSLLIKLFKKSRLLSLNACILKHFDIYHGTMCLVAESYHHSHPLGCPQTSLIAG